jgi:hypothetical protein
MGLLSACGETTTPMDAPDGGRTRDAGTPQKGNMFNGCTATVTTISELAPDAGILGSPRAFFQASSGTWTNSAGDELVVFPETTGTLHAFSGFPEPTGGLLQPCPSLDYVAMNAHLEIATKDGRLNESAEGEVRLQAGSVTFAWLIRLSALGGNLKPMEPDNLGQLALSGTYRSILGGPNANQVGWSVYGDIDNTPMPFDAGMGHGGAFGSSEIVNVPDFLTRTSPPASADAGAAP